MDGSSFERLGTRWSVGKTTAWRRVHNSIPECFPVGALIVFPSILTSRIVILDGKHFRIRKRPFTLYVAQDAENGKPFAWILLERYELRKGYDAILSYCRRKNVRINAAVSDWHHGIRASLHRWYPEAIHQRCAAHVLQDALRKLGGQWFLGWDTGRILWKEFCTIALRHSSREEAERHLNSLKDPLRIIHPKQLNALGVVDATLTDIYAWTRDTTLPIPRTSNRIESLMGVIEQRMKVCRGFQNPKTLLAIISTLLILKYQLPTKK